MPKVWSRKLANTKCSSNKTAKTRAEEENQMADFPSFLTAPAFAIGIAFLLYH